MASIPKLKLRDVSQSNGVHVPDDIEHATDTEPAMDRLKAYAKSIPYSIEPNSKMQNLLDFYITRLVQCLKAKDYDPGFLQWDTMITYWCMLKYPMPKKKRIGLMKIYYEVAIMPGLPAQVMAVAAEGLNALAHSKKKVSIEDIRLPWKPLYSRLSKELFLCRRKFDINQVPAYMGYIADSIRRFIHPAAVDEMLNTFLPMMNGMSLNTILTSQYYMLTFLPQSHPQSYLPMLFRIWESINSYAYDERMLAFLAQLAEMHVDPTVSDPAKIETIPDDARSEDEERPNWSNDDLKHEGQWMGITKEIGIFIESEWNLIMFKCLASMEIPLADTGSLTTGPSVDSQASFEINRLRKPTWRIVSLARIIVHSMAPDGPPLPLSTASTPWTSGVASPFFEPPPEKDLGDYLTARLERNGKRHAVTAYLAGSRALDSLARLIVSTESFFHPSNSGAWTADLSAFIKYIVYEFNKRWHNEQKPDCKTPKNRRLTRDMKRELVKCLRTVTLLAMFSRDSTTVANIQSCLKSMTVMEPDLILHPILERAFPALEALVETHRTTAMIKALGAVALSLVSRDIYYPGAKYLVPILQLLIPGIDLNDPGKTLCTTAFLIEVSQCITFGDLTIDETDEPTSAIDIEPRPVLMDDDDNTPPAIIVNGKPSGLRFEDSEEDLISRSEEDYLLKQSTVSFADWVASFIQRVIILFENLPEEGAGESQAAGETEEQVIDAVIAACHQICVHLTEPLFDMVLNMIYDYATKNVRANAVRAIHQLVECVSNANARKTLAKFMFVCSNNIQIELENGASSLRTTSMSSPMPSDATLHWSLAILKGATYTDGKALVKYRDELLNLFTLLLNKSYSQYGFRSASKFLLSVLLALTHTYPLENKFVNPEEWSSEEFRKQHHRYWGRLYKPGDVTISWHIPDSDEIDFALDLFRQIVEPALGSLEKLLDPGLTRDIVWRNDFCRYLTFVRNAFSGTPTLVKERITAEQLRESIYTSDIRNEEPEMIACIEPLNSGFALTDPDDHRFQYFTALRRRFGTFLRDASVVMRITGDENVVDPILMLIHSIRTYMLDYGDSRDSYDIQCKQYSNEMGLARRYANQKVWPRAVLVRRARKYHSARLHWNSIERYRGPLEDSLIDEVVEWSTWHYAIIRQSSQSLLESLTNAYDGIRRRSLPILCKALKFGTDHDRLKGALYSLNLSGFCKYILNEPSLATSFVDRLFSCQENEKPSIQDCVSVLSDSCLGSVTEPFTLVYAIENKGLSRALDYMEEVLPAHMRDDGLVQRCLDFRLIRTDLANDTNKRMVEALAAIATSPNTHWRYEIVALRCLRTFIRRDEALLSSQIKYFLTKTHDSHSSMRYYAQRAVMKSLRYIKLRSFCRSPGDLAMERSQHPLEQPLLVTNPSFDFTTQYLQSFKSPLDWNTASVKPTFHDKVRSGWLVWADRNRSFLAPLPCVYHSWEKESQETIDTVRSVVTDPKYWKNLCLYLAEENHVQVTTTDNISTVKSIFQLLSDEPFQALRPSLETMIADNDKNRQRAAAELFAGLVGGAKHWPRDKQARLWEWATPYIDKMLGSNVKSDTLLIWTSFIEYIFYSRDPRRVQPIINYLFEQFRSIDYNRELSFDAVKICSFIRALYEELGWKFNPWVDELIDRYWQELDCQHDEIRAYVADALEFSGRVKWQPKPSKPIAEVFVRECRLVPPDYDIMGIRGSYHKARVLQLVDRFPAWRKERLSGMRASLSAYDRVGVTVCKWLFQSVHDVQASSVFDYILPLMPELFRFAEVNDNKDLAARASALLVRMCGVVPPQALINPILDGIFDAIQSSSSWKVRLKALPLVQIFYFRQVPLISEQKVMEILEVVCKCLDDEIIEVREMAATTLSGILRLSPRHSILALKDSFVRLAEGAYLPPKQAPEYNVALRKLHAAILGICAIVDSYPYTVESWMPALLTDVLAEHTYDPCRPRFASALAISRKLIKILGMKIHNALMTVNSQRFPRFLQDHHTMHELTLKLMKEYHFCSR